MWVSWTITEIILPDWLKNLIHSINCWKRKCLSILRQNWKKHLIQSKKLSVTLANQHWNNPFQERSTSWWWMPASEVLDMPSWMKTIPTKRYSQSGKHTPPWRLAQNFSPRATQKSIYSKEFLTLYMAFLDFAHVLWEETKPAIVLTDNKSVTRFFQTKAIPPSLWDACDYVLHFSFKIAHIVGSVNTAADFLSRLERKEKSKQNAMQWTANEESPALKTSVKEFTRIDGNTTSYFMNWFKASARMCVEQYVDLVLKKMKLKILGQAHDEVLMMTDSRYKNYKANEDRMNLKNGLLFRKYFGETRSVKYLQILIPKQLVNRVLCSWQVGFGKHPGDAYREKYSCPKMAQIISEWVMSCEQCTTESRIVRSLTRPPLQNTNEHITALEDAMQIDLMPELPPTGGYENNVTAMDELSRYLCA